MAGYRDYRDIQWRNSGLSARVGFGVGSIDGRAILPALLVLLHLSMASLYIFFATIAFFALLEQLGFPFMTAVRRLRAIICGRTRFVNSTYRRRRRLVHG